MTVKPSEAAAELLARRRAKESLIAFTQYTKSDFQPADHHRWIADALEKVERGEVKRLMIFAPPRHTKSELSSRRMPAWYLGRNPGKQVITSTYAAEFAQDFGRDVREIVRSQEYARLFDTRLAADDASRGRWHTDVGGVYFAVGVGGPITGRGAHLAIIDDPIKNRQDAESQVIRDSVWHWYTSTLRTRLMPGGAIVLICTRWHEDDLAGRLLAAQENGGEQWEVVSLPALRFEEGQERALWPEWYPLTELKSIQGAIGPRDWLSLYQQTPTTEQGTFFKREWFKTYDKLPDKLNIYMSGDFAVTDGDGDYTEIAVWGVDSLDNIYCLDWWSGQSTADAWINIILDFTKRYQPLWFVGETGPIRRAVEPFLNKTMHERRIFVACEWLSSGGDKAAMARTFQAMCSVGKVSFPRTAWAERVIDQLLRFPSARYDDAVDACSLFGRYIDQTWAAIKKPEPKVVDWNAPLIIQDFEPKAA